MDENSVERDRLFYLLLWATFSLCAGLYLEKCDKVTASNLCYGITVEAKNAYEVKTVV